MQSRTAPVDLASGPTPELPALDSGLRLLATDDRAIATGALHALVLDHLLLSGGRALWVDTGGQIAPDHLARVVPNPRVLDRIQVARAFTPYQHYSLIGRLATRLDGTEYEYTHPGSDPAASSLGDVSVIVVPALDEQYRDDSALRGGRSEGQGMLLHALAVLDGLARRHDLPVLVTRTSTDALGTPVARAASGTIRCERTQFGPRFTVDGDPDSEDGDDGGDSGFETLVYPLGNGWVQTTLAFWRAVLAARAPLYEGAGADMTVATLPGETRLAGVEAQ